MQLLGHFLRHRCSVTPPFFFTGHILQWLHSILLPGTWIEWCWFMIMLEWTCILGTEARTSSRSHSLGILHKRDTCLNLLVWVLCKGDPKPHSYTNINIASLLLDKTKLPSRKTVPSCAAWSTVWMDRGLLAALSCLPNARGQLSSGSRDR